jgi:hypothetical protein
MAAVSARLGHPERRERQVTSSSALTTPPSPRPTRWRRWWSYPTGIEGGALRGVLGPADEPDELGEDGLRERE